MPPDTDQEKTEQATPRKRQKSRQRGQVAKSMDFSSAFVLLGGLSMLLVLGPRQAGVMVELAQTIFQATSSWEIDRSSFPFYAVHLMKQFLYIVGPFIGIIGIIALAANLGQVGFLFTLNPLEPKLDKLNPISGFKRILSKKTFVELLKSVFKVAIVAGIAYMTLRSEIHRFIPLADTSPADIISIEISSAVTLGLRIGLALLVLGVLDYVFQRSEHERDLKMSKQEVKEEFKQTEGNPQVKGRLRSIQRQAAMRRMMQDVPEADVVITNPDHVAVALVYDIEEMPAPRIVAKGENWLAQRIKEIAREAEVPVVENPPLARALYKLCKIGETVPLKLYTAVAEVLAYVYNLKKKDNRKKPL